MTTPDYIQYVAEQVDGVGEVRYKKMFGEYMLYVNDKPVLLVCDNTTYVKKSDAVAQLLSAAPCGIPYEGAKEHYVLDIDDGESAREVVRVLELEIPVPKKRTPKK